jgi:DNA primase
MSDINVEELKQAAPLIPYVKKYYPKIKFVSETEHVCHAFCVFHEENTGSLAFFSNGTYKCFGECGESGDVVTFVQRMENLTFLEACKLIGDNVGYKVELTPPNPYYEAYKDSMDNHTRRYWANLQNNQDALNYLENVRRITKETRDYFRLGVTDAQEYKYRSDIGNITDRIVFPILENKINNPKCIGMGYRDYRGNGGPKYVNDANQEGRENQDANLAGVFIKGNVLYGYPMAYDAIKRSGYLVLVEGYMDVVSLHQANVSNSVGSMGTSITLAQVQTIKRLTNNVILFMDSDNAGSNSMLKALPLMYEQGLNVTICSLNNGYDPADLCMKFDFDEVKIKNVIKKNTRPAINVFIDSVVYGYEQVATRERAKSIQMALPLLDSLQNEMDKELFKKMLYNRLNI